MGDPLSFRNRDVIAISDFSKEEILHILDHTSRLKKQNYPDLLKGHILGSCFFEPSTRTRLSFEAAMHKLGGTVIGFADGNATSVKKGESLHDSMKMLEGYADVVVIRHPLEGAAQCAADSIHIPVINAGDGSNQHPTQTFLDLFSIQECQYTLENLKIALVGDLKYGRTIHSLVQALAYFNARLYFISHPSLEMPKQICDDLNDKGIKFSFHKTIEEIIDKVDILYMQRIQAERFTNSMEYELVKDSYILKKEMLRGVKPNLKVLHALPRMNEIEKEVDKTSYAYYFQQAHNGLYARQALLALVLGKI